MRPLTADKLFARAEVLRRKNRYPEAIPLFRSALSRYRKDSDLPGILNCQLAIGDLGRMIGNFKDSEASYAQAILTSTRLGDRASLADATVGMGLSARGRGDWKSAIRLCLRASRHYLKNNDEHGVAFSLWALAGAYRIKGDIPSALSAYRNAHDLFKRLSFDSAVGYCLCGLGGTSRFAGRFADSRSYYRSANRLMQKLGDRFGTAYSYCGLGNAYRMTGRFTDALESFAKASAIYRTIGDRVSYAYTLWSLGTTHKMLGDLGRAAAFFREAAALFRATKDPRGLIYCRLGFAELAHLSSQPRTAERLVSQSIESAKTHGFRVELCHARYLAASIAGKTAGRCYRDLGLKLELGRPPLNIP